MRPDTCVCCGAIVPEDNQTERKDEMVDKAEIRARLDFRMLLLSKLRTAYISLIDGGVKSYTIDDRQLTKFDLPEIKRQIDDLECETDQLRSQLAGKRQRKAFGVLPRDW